MRRRHLLSLRYLEEKAALEEQQNSDISHINLEERERGLTLNESKPIADARMKPATLVLAQEDTDTIVRSESDDQDCPPTQRQRLPPIFPVTSSFKDSSTYDDSCPPTQRILSRPPQGGE